MFLLDLRLQCFKPRSHELGGLLGRFIPQLVARLGEVVDHIIDDVDSKPGIATLYREAQEIGLADGVDLQVGAEATQGCFPKFGPLCGVRVAWWFDPEERSIFGEVQLGDDAIQRPIVFDGERLAQKTRARRVIGDTSEFGPLQRTAWNLDHPDRNEGWTLAPSHYQAERKTQQAGRYQEGPVLKNKGAKFSNHAKVCRVGRSGRVDRTPGIARTAARSCWGHVPIAMIAIYGAAMRTIIPRCRATRIHQNAGISFAPFEQ